MASGHSIEERIRAVLQTAQSIAGALSTKSPTKPMKDGQHVIAIEDNSPGNTTATVTATTLAAMFAMKHEMAEAILSGNLAAARILDVEQRNAEVMPAALGRPARAAAAALTALVRRQRRARRVFTLGLAIPAIAAAAAAAAAATAATAAGVTIGDVHN